MKEDEKWDPEPIYVLSRLEGLGLSLGLKIQGSRFRVWHSEVGV